MGNIRIVGVCEDDAQFLYEIMNDPDILAALGEVPTQPDDWIDAIAAWKCDPDEEDYIIFDEKTPVGWLGVNGLLSEDKTAYIKMIGLLPQYQGRGTGAFVIRNVLDMLRSRGFAAAALYTNQDNHRAQKCYAKCGFQIAEELIEEMSNGRPAARYKMVAIF